MSPASYQTAPPRDVVLIRPPLPCHPSGRPLRAGNGTRTRDPNLGKVVLYQLSYSRERRTNVMEPIRDFYRRADRTGMEARGIEPLTS
jgi:hypothetical protein